MTMPQLKNEYVLSLTQDRLHPDFCRAMAEILVYAAETHNYDLPEITLVRDVTRAINGLERAELVVRRLIGELTNPSAMDRRGEM